jgi:hypothetical protein
MGAYTWNARATSSGTANPYTLACTCSVGDALLVLGIVNAASATRAGGSPTFNGYAMTLIGAKQASETCVELWYTPKPFAMAATVSIPNSAGKSLFVCAQTFKANDATMTASLAVNSASTGDAANSSTTIVTPTTQGLSYSVMGHGLITAPTAYTGTSSIRYDAGAYSISNGWCNTSTGTWTNTWTVALDDWCMITAHFSQVEKASGEDFMRNNIYNYNTRLAKVAVK